MTGPYPHARPGLPLRCAPTLLLLLALPVALVGCAETSRDPDRADGGPVGDDDDDDTDSGDDDDDDNDACDQTTSCGDDQFCDVDPATCGGPQGSGTCEQRPEVCTDDCPGVCGCDGMSYCNACDAQAAGVDVSSDESCLEEEPCNPQDAQAVGPCDAFFGTAWDGSQCVALSGCACVGVDCDGLFESLEACETAFSDCLD